MSPFIATKTPTENLSIATMSPFIATKMATEHPSRATNLAAVDYLLAVTPRSAATETMAVSGRRLTTSLSMVEATEDPFTNLFTAQTTENPLKSPSTLTDNLSTDPFIATENPSVMSPSTAIVAPAAAPSTVTFRVLAALASLMATDQSAATTPQKTTTPAAMETTTMSSATTAPGAPWALCPTRTRRSWTRPCPCPGHPSSQT